ARGDIVAPPEDRERRAGDLAQPGHAVPDQDPVPARDLQPAAVVVIDDARGGDRICLPVAPVRQPERVEVLLRARAGLVVEAERYPAGAMHAGLLVRIAPRAAALRRAPAAHNAAARRGAACRAVAPARARAARGPAHPAATRRQAPARVRAR